MHEAPELVLAVWKLCLTAGTNHGERWNSRVWIEKSIRSSV